MHSETVEGCWNCGARARDRTCNNPQSPMYKQYAGFEKCGAWIHRVFTPPAWSKRK